MDQLGGYRLVAHLGRGGMADVYLAFVSGPSGSNFTKLAVVKRLRTKVAEDPDLVAMFLDEAKILALLRHPNVVQIIEVGTHHGEAFFAMEYLDGLSLRRLRQKGTRARIAIDRDLELVTLVDTLSGLQHAHELETWDGKRLDIVHRDVTPHNIFVTVDGQVKVLDFGIAKAALRDAVTEHGVIKGKLRYMSPEQAGGGTVGVATDIFAVGVSLWEALTGKRFWGGIEERDIVLRLLGGDYGISPRAVDPSVPEALDAICRRALAFRIEDRYATAAEMREDLERELGDGIVSARRRLSALVTQLAAEERARLREMVDTAARARFDETQVMALPSASTVVPVVVDPVVAPAPEKRGRAKLLVGVLGIVALGLLFVTMAVRKASVPSRSPSARDDGRTTLAMGSDDVALAPSASSSPVSAVVASTEPPKRYPPWRPATHSRAAPRAVVAPTPATTPSAHPSANIMLDRTDPWKTGGASR